MLNDTGYSENNMSQDQEKELSHDFKSVSIPFDQAQVSTPEEVKIDTTKQSNFNTREYDDIQPSAEQHIMMGDGDTHVVDESAENADDEEDYLGLYLNIQNKIFKTSNRIIDDIKADLLFLLNEEGDRSGILRQSPLNYSSKLSQIKYNPFDLLLLNQSLEYAPAVEHRRSRFNPSDRITIIRSLLYSSKEPSLSRTKVYHVKILIKKKESTSSLDVPKNEFHLVDQLNEVDAADLIESKLVEPTDSDKVKAALPKLVDEANYVCAVTNKIFRIEISEPEFDHDDLHDYEMGPINVRYTKALDIYQDLNSDIPSPAQCLYTLFKAIRGPLVLKENQEHRTINATNKSLNSNINPKILTKRLHFDLSHGEFDPPNISDLNDRQSSIVRESYVRKILEIMLLGRKSYSGRTPNPFSNFDFTSSPNFIFHELGDSSSINHHEFTTDANYINLSSQSFFNDELVTSCYEKTVYYDPSNVPVYFDSLRSISNHRQTYKISSYVSKLLSLNVIGQKDIDDAYTSLSIDPVQAEQIDDDMLLTMYKNEVALHPLDAKLRNSLTTLANQRSSDKLKRYLKYESLPLNQAYDVLDIDSTVDDDVVSTAAIVKKVDSPNEAGLVDRALLTIATERKSFTLLDQLEKEKHDLYEPMTFKEACEYLGVDELANDFQAITIFQMGNGEIRTARNALRTIGKTRNSKLIDSFLKTGLIDHNSLPAENWPVGLNNIGNTCYLNSLLQYYFSIKPFRDFALEFRDVYEGQDIYKNRRIGGRLVGDSEVIRAFQFVYQLRDLFYDQIHSNKRCITPKKELAYLAFLPAVEAVDFGADGNAKGDKDGEDNEDDLKKPSTNEVYNKGANKDDAILIQSSSTVNESEHKPNGELNNEEYDLIDLSEQEDDDDNNDDVVMVDSTTQKKNDPITPISRDEGVSDLDTDKTMVEAEDDQSKDEAGTKRPEPTPEEKLRIATRAAKISETQMETAYEIGRQQDVTECIGNVLSQVEAALKPEGFDNEDNEQQDMVKNLFFGKTVQHLTDLTNPSNKRDKVDRFSNLFVNISDQPRNIYEAFDRLFKSEEVSIDGGPYKRSERITKLPVFLQVQIQRVYFDKELLRVYKSIEPLPFPETLYMDRYLDTEDPEIIKRRDDVEAWKSEIKSLQDRKSRLLSKNQQGITFRDSLISTKDWLKHQQIAKAETIEVLEKQVNKIDEELVGIYEKTHELEKKIDHHFDSFQKHGYNIFAIFIHRGEASYGHYWIYIKDHHNKMFRKYNDEIVSEVPTSEVFNFDEGNTATPYFLGYVQQGHENEIEPLCRVLQAQH